MPLRGGYVVVISDQTTMRQWKYTYMTFSSKPAGAASLPEADTPHVVEALAAAAAVAGAVVAAAVAAAAASHHTELHMPVALDMSSPGSSAQCSSVRKTSSLTKRKNRY